MNDYKMRPARAEEGAALSWIAVLAKAHWGYANAQVDAWRADLTVDPSLVPHRWTRVAEANGEPVGVVQLAFGVDAADILHLWIHPGFMRCGIGRALMAAAMDESRRRGMQKITIDSDPFAEPFYIAMGARRVGETRAPIDGQPDRIRPQLVIAVDP
ncbi:MAG: GNAT family N-acetyltransferase, partial [Betaproteobacteria bacterium]|nr:GNAT family N-acetyltransferase [Betaproteobacteria bacterium]